MAPQEFEKLIDKDKYQVFVLASRASFPLSFAIHPWLVINKKGEISRYEIRHYLNTDKSYGYLHINAEPPFLGLPAVYPFNRFFQKTRLLGYIEGDGNSKAKDLAERIEGSRENYPYLKKYSFLGKNCATYVHWALNTFPELKLKLPWNCFGKNYKDTGEKHRRCLCK